MMRHEAWIKAIPSLWHPWQGGGVLQPLPSCLATPQAISLSFFPSKIHMGCMVAPGEAGAEGWKFP